MWSAVHFLSGFLLAGVSYKTGLDLVSASVGTVIILLLWELFEWLIKIIEPSVNVLVDIVIGVGGFALGATLFFSAALAVGTVFYGALAVTVALSLWGFFDFYKRGYR